MTVRALPVLTLVLLACGNRGGAPRDVEPRRVSDAGAVTATASPCPATGAAPDPLPGDDPRWRDAATWLGTDADAPVLTAAEVATLATARGGAAGGPALTRRAWIGAALALVGQPADGDPVGGLLAALGLPVDGSFTIDLAAADAGERQILIDAAARAGVVVAEAGDDRMVWLGRDAGGAGRVVHAVVAYDAPCVTPADGRTATRLAVGKVAITGLDLGAGSAAGPLLDRLTRLVVLARVPGPELEGAVALRPAAPVAAPARCDDRDDAAIFFSPARPSAEQPLRVIATLSEDPGPVELALIGPDGARHTPTVERLGGPPFSYVVTVDAPAAGRWTAVLGDGDRVDACARAEVSKHRRKTARAGDAVWPGRRRRGVAVENLYAAFVEKLFDYPVDQDLTWPNLHTVLRDRDHNLLYDYLGQREEAKLELEPDCADLPYTLEAYFAWKLDLPYGYRVCDRGSGKHAPRCDRVDEARPPGDNLMARADLRHQDDVGAFEDFAGKVMGGVSSSSGRTAPGDSATDWYPVPLTRAALRPGTLFADPYGHLMVMVRWYAQAPGGYGILMGADAQPDATVGRRRFWRGNYLYASDTTRAGAGFKAYRPHLRSSGAIVDKDNRALKKAGWWVPWSDQQYAGTTDDFYDAMEALINPRPLDALKMQGALVDALAEAVVRRVSSVANGEAYMATAARAIDMPQGAKIFLSAGPWEDYSTPARDHRILIAIDTVLGLADAVARRPERYRLAPADVPDMVARLATSLDALLASRTFAYTRSDGSTQTLTLADVVARQAALEMAYNPNDCAEIRWGAPEGSAELSTCTRHAPAAQRARMERYRAWFHDRERPVE